MKKTAILISMMFLLSISTGSVSAFPESGYGVLVVDSDSGASVFIVEERINFTAPAWVELPALKEGENYTLIIKIDGLDVKIPVLIKEGLATIVKVKGDQVEKSILAEGATPVEVQFGSPISLPPKLKGPEPALECMVATYGPINGRGLVFELMKDPNGDGYFLLPNETPVEICGEYYLVEMYGVEDGWASVGHFLNWTTHVPEYREIEIDSYPKDSAVLVFGASYNVLRTPIKLFVPIITNVTQGYGFDMNGRRLNFRLDPIPEYNITLASNVTITEGLAPRISFIVNSPVDEAEIGVNFTALTQAVSLKIVYGLPPEYRNLPNGLESTSEVSHGAEENQKNEENGTLRNSTLVITTYPENAKVAIDGKTVCVGKCVLNVTPGEHEITGGADGFVEESRRVVLAPGERLVLNLTLSPYPRFEVVSVPEGAHLYIDGNSTACITPCNITLTPGTHTLVLKKEGFRDYRTTVKVKGGDSGVISVTLTDLSGRRYTLDPRIKNHEDIPKGNPTNGNSSGFPISGTTAYVIGGIALVTVAVVIARKL
ncbi:PEGA domain-containing protein [Thermococcus sp. 18S1]|uniref:PEGA domain-containing protein n=1 Tax=Thermococcus sp. 18S1 TaxID=1638210 RepID=UPI00143AD04D|nr:PEGA domain-containing protein [Thermococcus sp. 18S1]NJE31317.1 PEGA domain-containing protein [Thermococcus sp. 18S1]